MLDKTTFSAPLNNLITLCKSVLTSAEFEGECLDSMDLIKAHRIELFLPKQILSEVCNPTLLAQLANRKQVFSQKYLRFQNAIHQIQKEFNSNNLEVLILKGIPLNHLLFGNKVTRNSRDIDALVKVEDLDKVHQVLTSIGFVKTCPEFEISADQQNLFLQEFDQITYYSEKLKCQLEIHWKLFRNKGFLPVSAEEIWNSVQTINVNGLKIKTLSNDLLSIYVSLHGAQHQWDSLIWIIDMYKFIPVLSEKDISSALKTTQKHNCTEVYLLGFYMAYLLLDAQVPLSISNLFSNKIKNLANSCLNFLATNKHSKSDASTLRKMLFSIRVNQSITGKIHHFYNFPQYSLNHLKSNRKIIHWTFRPVIQLMEKSKKTK